MCVAISKGTHSRLRASLIKEPKLGLSMSSADFNKYEISVKSKGVFVIRLA